MILLMVVAWCALSILCAALWAWFRRIHAELDAWEPTYLFVCPPTLDEQGCWCDACFLPAGVSFHCDVKNGIGQVVGRSDEVTTCTTPGCSANLASQS